MPIGGITAPVPPGGGSFTLPGYGRVNTAPKPSTPARPGFEWRLVSGQWTQVPVEKSPEEMQQAQQQRVAGDLSNESQLQQTRTAEDAAFMARNLATNPMAGVNATYGPTGGVVSSAGPSLEGLAAATGGAGLGSRFNLQDMLAQIKQAIPAREQYPTVDESAARAAAFARAKDAAGRTARASLNSLYDLMASTGRSGSGVEAMLSGELAGQGAGNLADFEREQYIQEANRASQRAGEQFQGGITQRAQDIGATESLLGILRALGGRLY